jgi:hypothetical protein
MFKKMFFDPHTDWVGSITAGTCFKVKSLEQTSDKPIGQGHIVLLHLQKKKTSTCEKIIPSKAIQPIYIRYCPD